MGNGESPLKTHTEALTNLLNEALNDEQITVHMAMRYQYPAMEDVLTEMQHQNYNRIIILPLFPHYASSSSGSAIQKALSIISNALSGSFLSVKYLTLKSTAFSIASLVIVQLWNFS